MSSSLFRRHIALTQEHGSWVFLFSPLLIGIFSAPGFQAASAWFFLAAVSVFLFRHPLTFTVKIAAGRRRRTDLPAAAFWMAVYGLFAFVGLAGLIALDQSWLALLALPGAPILAWHLWLVFRRAERRQIGLEIIASGVLALAAPGAYWAGLGEYDPVGWWLWVLGWLQSAESITYAALRLEQRSWKEMPDARVKLLAARRALVYTGFNLAFSASLGLTGQVPELVWIAFGIQWLETLQGTCKPAIRTRPTTIGVRQLIVSTIFTITFVVLWRSG